MAHSLSDFDFDLPPDLIAQHPAPTRTGSRLLDGSALAQDGGQPVDRRFTELPALLRAGDLLVFNDTQVIKARLFGQKSSGGKAELLVERVLHGQEVAAHLRVSKKPAVGSVISLQTSEQTVGPSNGKSSEILQARLLSRWPDADGPLYRFELTGSSGADPLTLLDRHGHVPLPPYITHSDSDDDATRYQTVVAKHPGAVAAPTAALHFDEALLARLMAQGVERASVTLHVGAGTFQPVKTENLAEHRMHSEWYRIPPDTLEAIARCQARGGRVVAVGTTTVRTLESWAKTRQTEGETAIFITPGFQFEAVDVLLTNFHLPKSTLMMLVSAFAGYDNIRRLYAHAIAQRYRFFSYGDSMLLKRAGA
ncbi:MAG: hypothetical protein RLZZ126_1393 [Pseudomonadota bacterium]|jgi:S-adenosylmethionine:tRNA ribosyltransferase-isomerase